MTPRPATREKRGHVTMERLARALSLEQGIPVEYAFGMVRALFRLIREDLDASARFVLPGALIIDRMPPGAKKSHRVRLVLTRRKRAAEKMRRYRAANG